ncbi:dihydroorotate oxidase [Pseudoramibacter alactolyticus ATCC 23263]|jgi:dihydroorotate dehydrogenase (NAD+) catalytic subunit|uniref:Dihydroorotate dehydrogenase n=1 Tax=Pseudoramibacter alactolyticus ATCC 23263 TaxID=887929 RepID=E6MJT2_9FIRM|nr:dihydroorotate dehydrogenase [Pseudoramibacter alactolyticus]EFV00671.1 dihydroorotate oxidase [Pseudoramibacter alactolyticus ATCC 23263]
MSARLTTDFAGITFKNPVVPASGTFGFGREFEQVYDLERLGGLCTKGLTIAPKPGNTGTRIWETPAGIINSIGLENPGVDAFIVNEWPHLSALDTVTVVNVGGSDEASYLAAIEKLNDLPVALIELNISCPNVKCGGMAFGMDPDQAGRITEKAAAASTHPIMVKLTPNAPDIVAVARACEAAGAAGLSLINTIQAMAVDVDAKKIVFDNIYAGLSGPAVKPIALRITHQVVNAVRIPVMAMGGIADWRDALEFIMVGATCVQVGTMNFVTPTTAVDIVDGLEAYCEAEGLDNIAEVRGILNR